MFARGLRVIGLFVPVLLLFAMAQGPAAAASQARAATPAPPWWNGTCDVGNNPGSHPLGASFHGVQACGPGSAQGGSDRLVRFYPGAWGEYEWECVELSMRYMYLVYGIDPYNANGNTVVADYTGKLLAKVANNGTALPSPGDIVSESLSGNPDGHTGVVTAVNVTNGTGTVTIMEQNASANGQATIPVSGGVLGSGVTGWLHHGGGGGGTGGSGGPPPPTPDVPWHFQTLDGGKISGAGLHPAAASYRGTLQVFYYDARHGYLRHAWNNATGWHFQTLDGSPGSAAGREGGASSDVGGSLASTVYRKSLQVFYYSASTKGLRHAWYIGSRWHFENLDGGTAPTLSGDTDHIGRNPSVAVDGRVLQLFSYDATAGDLRHDWYDAAGWHFENLDGPTSTIGPDPFRVGRYSAAITDHGTLEVFYYDNTWGDLRYAWAGPGAAWQFENLDGLGGRPASREGPGVHVGLYPAAVVAGGVPNVFYYDATHEGLRHAWLR
jgi:CHAP domain